MHPRLSLLIAAAVATPALSAGPTRSFSITATYVDTTSGTWSMRETPNLVRRPTLATLDRMPGGAPASDVSISFNCAIAGGGALRDCRLLYAEPAGTDGTALMRALAPAVRIERGSVALARAKAYRITIDAGLAIPGPDGRRQSCLPPQCIVEGLAPPPPPAVAEDPVVAGLVARARACFEARWEASRPLRFAAEKAVRAAAGRPDDAARSAATAYVASRQAIMACITDLETGSRKLPLQPSDAGLVADTIKSMRFNYNGQTRYEMAILIGLIDPAAAERELGFAYPN